MQHPESTVIDVMSESFVIPSRVRRLSAYLYEALIVLAILFLAGAFAVAARGGEAMPENSVLFQLYLVAWLALYFVICWTYGGQSVGMRAWKLHLVSTNSRPLTPARMALRFLLALIGLAALGVGHLWLLFDDQRRALHDVLCGTLVIQEDPDRKRP